MIFYLAGMQSIDDSIYEAADIDGANAFTKNAFTNPSVANKLLNIIEYATNDVTHGKNIAVLKNPLPFNFLSFNKDDIKSASIIITGT